MKMLKKIQIFCFVTVFIFSIAAIAQEFEEVSVLLAPDRLVTHSQDDLSTTIIALMPYELEPGYQIGDYFDISFSIYGNVVAHAASLEYRALDNNLSAVFEKQEILESDVIDDYANQIVKVEISGCFEAVGEDDTVTICIQGYDYLGIRTARQGRND